MVWVAGCRRSILIRRCRVWRPWDPSQTFAEFVVPDTVVAGDRVTVSGDGVVKEHVVLDVSFSVDVGDDTVSGTGSPSADINVNINDDPGAHRHEVADASPGAFVADFSTPGDEECEQDTTMTSRWARRATCLSRMGMGTRRSTTSARHGTSSRWIR